MKVSARNAFEGTINAIEPGAVNTEVTIKTDGGDTMVAIVTAGSVKSMGLALGKQVTALVKAPWVMLMSGEGKLHFSARNQLAGKVSSIEKGGVNSEVGVQLPGGTEVFAVVTNDAVADLGLAVGKPATAIIKASHVILAVSA